MPYCVCTYYYNSWPTGWSHAETMCDDDQAKEEEEDLKNGKMFLNNKI